MSPRRSLRPLALSTSLLSLAALFLARSATPSQGTGGPAAATVAPVGKAGQVACGAHMCNVGSEMCCLDSAPRCVPLPISREGAPVAASTESEALERWRACGSNDFTLCDDAADCGSGQTCCTERSYESDGMVVTYGACKPLAGGKVMCGYDELCSDADTTCQRKGTTCGPRPSGSAGRCAFPASSRTKPRCGAAPCADGMVCVVDEGNRACVPGPLEFPESMSVIECERGRDCAEDESCYQNPQASGHRCDVGLAGVDAMSEPALCTGAEDCKGFCRQAAAHVPSCWIDEENAGGRCECLPTCTTDADCEECPSILMQRFTWTPTHESVCDHAKGACDCRPAKPSP